MAAELGEEPGGYIANYGIGEDRPGAILIRRSFDGFDGLLVWTLSFREYRVFQETKGV